MLTLQKEKQTFGTMTLSIMTFSIMTLGIKAYFAMHLTIRPNLKLKTLPKQLLDFLLIDFVPLPISQKLMIKT
jgi:hypothetical protein